MLLSIERDSLHPLRKSNLQKEEQYDRRGKTN